MINSDAPVIVDRRVRDRRERQPKAICPGCGHWDSHVVKGWPDPRGYTRKRECTACERLYKTRETVLSADAE